MIFVEVRVHACVHGFMLVFMLVFMGSCVCSWVVCLVFVARGDGGVCQLVFVLPTFQRTATWQALVSLHNCVRVA